MSRFESSLKMHNIRHIKNMVRDLGERAIALKHLGYRKQAKFLFRSARHFEAKSMVLARIAHLQWQAKLNRLRKENGDF